ncbi:ATP-dependent Clp protease proteolytic subunit [Sporomusa silvacetica DSM 10669]|uniref:ATP-dependent Clp protease proteolytic subunit n=1 Tax=Sporomusa silvacetica DSM 10669 TaxID=1123289 RepID=A0ABZ3IHD1_9FIRM|nr:head maturation protease, ClpP-related [Sporomusa silvacetica]OZC13143.1 ATP-dependent Clp protease proteolytic subunit [Sporomusa silvacetica DSM 10669]
MKRFWNFKNDAKDEDVILRIDGDIVDDDESWIYEWLGIAAASPNSFRNELAQYVGKNISVWIDSYGGSVFAATGIYNALMEHKKTGAKVTTIIDSRAMSAATIPAMAGDERKITIGGIFMMHNPLTGAYGYATDLRKTADVLDVVKETIVNAYQIATKLDRNKIASMMDDETYMSAKTAIKEGFATEIHMPVDSQGEKAEPIMNFSFNRLAIQNAANDSMKNFFEVAKKFGSSQEPPMKPAANKQKNKEDTEMEINSVEDLKKEKPDLVNQVVNDAVTSERARITALDALDDPKNAAVHEIIIDAKAAGKTAEDVQKYVDIAKKHIPVDKPADPAQDFMTKAIIDNKASGVDGALATGANNTGADDKQKDAEDISFMASVINKKNGRVK